VVNKDVYINSNPLKPFKVAYAAQFNLLPLWDMLKSTEIYVEFRQFTPAKVPRACLSLKAATH